MATQQPGAGTEQALLSAAAARTLERVARSFERLAGGGAGGSGVDFGAARQRGEFSGFARDMASMRKAVDMLGGGLRAVNDPAARAASTLAGTGKAFDEVASTVDRALAQMRSAVARWRQGRIPGADKISRASAGVASAAQTQAVASSATTLTPVTTQPSFADKENARESRLTGFAQSDRQRATAMRDALLGGELAGWQGARAATQAERASVQAESERRLADRWQGAVHAREQRRLMQVPGVASEELRAGYAHVQEAARTRRTAAEMASGAETGHQEVKAAQVAAYREQSRASLAEEARDLQRLVALEGERLKVMRSQDGHRLLGNEASNRRMAGGLILDQQLERQRARHADRASPEGAAELKRQAGAKREYDVGRLRERVEAEERAADALREAPALLREQLELEQRLAKVARARADAARDARMQWARSQQGATGTGGAPGTPGPARAGWTAGMVQAAEHSADRLKAMQERALAARHEADYRQTAQGRRDTREQKRIASQIVFQNDRAAGGTLFAGTQAASRWLDDFGKRLDGVAQVGQRTFATLAAGAAGFASVADPFASWPTLMGSFKDLAQSVGQMLTPILVELSAHLQGAASWVRSLSDEFKENAVRVAIWVGGAALGVATVTKLVLAAKALVTALGGVKVALATTGIGAVIGIVGALAGEYALLGDKASYAAKMMANGANAATGLKTPKDQLAQNAITEKDLREVPEAHRKTILEAGTDREKLQAALKEFNRAADEALKKAMPQTIPDLAEKMRQDEQMEKLLGGTYEQIERYRKVQTQQWIPQWDMRRTMPQFEKDLWDWLQPGVRDKQVNRRWDEWENQDTREAMRLAREAIVSRKEGDPRVFQTFERDRTGGPDFMRPKAGVTGKDVEEARKRGEAPESDILARILAGTRRGRFDDPERWFGADFKNLSSFTAGFRKNADFLHMEKNLKLSQSLLEKSGGQHGMLANIRWPTQPAITDPMAFADRLQMQALDGGDLDRHILRRQLEEAEKLNVQMQKVNEKLDRLNMPDAPEAPKNNKR